MALRTIRVMGSMWESPSVVSWQLIKTACCACVAAYAAYVFISFTPARKQMSPSAPLVFVCGLQKWSVDVSTLQPYWQMKRRKRDLNPRAGCPTYTLSRGASSAS